MSEGIIEDKKIGLWGLIFTITGFVVGVSIFILPAELIDKAGPAVLLAYSISGAMAVVTCFATAQIGTLMPAEGGTYVAISRLLSPFYGFLAVFVLLCSVVLVNSFVAYGFADYIVYFFPGLNKMAAAASIVIFFGIVNIIGSDLVVKFQSVMVIMFLIMLSIFIITGLSQFEVSNLTPLYAQTELAQYFRQLFLVIFLLPGLYLYLSLAGRLKKPTVNIPLGLGISFIIVLASYGGISLVLSGLGAGGGFEGMVTPVLDIAKTFFPEWLVSALVVSIIVAAATTVNGLILGYSRDILVIAEAKVFPEFLSKRSKKYKTPIYAIIAYTALSVAAILTGSDIEDYALVAVMGLLLQQLFISVSLFRLPKVMQNEYDNAEFKLNKPLLLSIAVLLFMISFGFIIMMVMQEPVFGLLILGVLGVGSLYYLFITKNKGNSHEAD